MQVMAVATSAAALTWMMIVLTHLRFRKAQAGSKLHFPAPWYPWANYLCAAFLVGVVALMTQLDTTRPAVYVLPVWLVVLFYVGYRIRQRVGDRKALASN